MTVTANEMSLLTILHGAITSGTLSAAMGIEGGAQELRFAGGLHQLAQCVAADLGEAVRLSHPVTSIELRSTVATVRTEHGSFEARRVILAVPPSALGRISFTPGLPASHAALETMMPMGSVIKMNAVFERPFWRDAGWSGLVTSDEGAFGFMIDNSASGTDEGVLTTFLSASHARQWGDARLGATASAQRRKLLTDHVQRTFGAGSPEPVAYVDCDWVAQPWIGGGYSGVMRPGGWLAFGPSLREPVGPLHWASSERATMWTGYVEGALESGERAAREVLASHD
jgi:monoamine oxidase